MLDQASRSKEIATAKENWSRRLQRQVASVNQQLQWQRGQLEMAKRIESIVAKRNDPEALQKLHKEVIAPHTAEAEDLAIAGRKLVAAANDGDRDGLPASKYKARGQWMTSLISNGAIVGWLSSRYNSSDGDQLWLRTTGVDEDGAQDGMTFTERELNKNCEDGARGKYSPTPPLWSTVSGEYPSFNTQPNAHEDQTISEGDSEPEAHPRQNIVSMASLIPKPFLAQELRAERTLSRKGNISVRVFVTNVFANGQIEEKEFKDNSRKVMEEVDKAEVSNAELHEAYESTIINQVVKAENELLSQYPDEDDHD